MTLLEAIRTAILEHFKREAVVYLVNGRDIVVAPDLGSVEELAAEIPAAVVRRRIEPTSTFDRV